MYTYRTITDLVNKQTKRNERTNDQVYGHKLSYHCFASVAYMWQTNERTIKYVDINYQIIVSPVWGIIMWRTNERSSVWTKMIKSLFCQCSVLYRCLSRDRNSHQSLHFHEFNLHHHNIEKQVYVYSTAIIHTWINGSC